MPLSDQQKWDAKYSRFDQSSDDIVPFLNAHAEQLPSAGRVLDVAGGAGRHAIWLAHRGLTVTVADISPKGLAIAKCRSIASGVELETLHCDLVEQPFPSGPWVLIVCTYFLHRPLYMDFYRELVPGGVLVVVQPTRSNLIRHAHPSDAFLLDDGELAELSGHFEQLVYHEGWQANGRHEAHLVARRR